MAKQLTLFPNQPQTANDINKQTSLGATFDLFAEFLRKEGKTEHTIKAFRGDMNLLAEYSDATTPISHYRTSDLNAYLDWMENQRGVPCSQKTYARRVTTLKVYFKWLAGLKALRHDPALAILQRSGSAPLSEVLTMQQVDDCIEASLAMMVKKGDVQDYRPELLFRLLLQTGIKKSEAGRLKLEDIDRSNAQMPVMIIRHKAKNVYKERRIVLDEAFLTLLDLYAMQYQPQDTVFTCTTRNLEYILTDVGQRAEVPFKLSFEVMRWTSAVHDFRSDVDEDIIREKLGLSKITWYETYNKIQRISERLDEV
jgi:integrase/recombinase XerD